MIKKNHTTAMLRKLCLLRCTHCIVPQPQSKVPSHIFITKSHPGFLNVVRGPPSKKSKSFVKLNTAHFVYHSSTTTKLGVNLSESMTRASNFQDVQLINTMVTLIVATSADAASVGPAEALLRRGVWAALPDTEHNKAWANQHVRLWLLSEKLIHEDHLDKRWESASGEKVTEVIFMSRHVASSGKPALTVHPIGVPHMLPGQIPPAGGEPGWAAPPCTRLGPWFRLLADITKKAGLGKEFEVTLEATHHGPTLHSPAMFCEIGSCEALWGREDAAEAMADLFFQGLGLDGGVGEGDWATAPPGTPVLVGIGGGHYAPRHGDVAKKDRVWLGHIISGYSLPMEEHTMSTSASTSAKNKVPLPRSGHTPETSQQSNIGTVLPENELIRSSESVATEEREVSLESRWQHVIRTAVETTKIAFPGGRVMVHLDSKSFKSWQRKAIILFCETEGIIIGKPTDFTLDCAVMANSNELN